MRHRFHLSEFGPGPRGPEYATFQGAPIGFRVQVFTFPSGDRQEKYGTRQWIAKYLNVIHAPHLCRGDFIHSFFSLSGLLLTTGLSLIPCFNLFCRSFYSSRWLKPFASLLSSSSAVVTTLSFVSHTKRGSHCVAVV